MMEGYMVYLTMLYMSEYLPNLASKLNLCRMCDPDSNNNFEGEYLKGKGRSRKVKGNYYLLDVYYIVHSLIAFSIYCIN